MPGAQVAAQDPDLFVRVNGAALLGGGMLLATGRMPRLASTVLAASVVPTTAIDHAFWEETDPDPQGPAASLFFKNVGLLGGLLLAAVDTEGKPRHRVARAAGARAPTRREARHARRTATREARLLAHQAKDVVS